jgi:hypothetical protein
VRSEESRKQIEKQITLLVSMKRVVCLHILDVVNQRSLRQNVLIFVDFVHGELEGQVVMAVLLILLKNGPCREERETEKVKGKSKPSESVKRRCEFKWTRMYPLSRFG